MDELPARAPTTRPSARSAASQPEGAFPQPGAPPERMIADTAAQLRGRAFLYDDPDAYAAGVRDALSELNSRLEAPPVQPGS